jgi:aryl-alcohol dehydrogenase-like predicted oxidoreductase
MEFVPRTFIDFEENCTKAQCKYRKLATRYILAKSAVAGVIIGVRLGIVDHRNSNAQVFNFSLDKSDCNDIDAVCTKSNNLFEVIGDCGDEYR